MLQILEALNLILIPFLSCWNFQEALIFLTFPASTKVKETWEIGKAEQRAESNRAACF